jgi:hypothetical protein
MPPQLTDYELDTAARACRALAHREGERREDQRSGVARTSAAAGAVRRGAGGGVREGAQACRIVYTMNDPAAPPEPLPAGTDSALAAAAQDPAPRPRNYGITPSTGYLEYQGSPVVLLLSLASQNLLAHARELSTKQDGQSQQFAVVFAHAACDLHTEWGINQLLDIRPDKTLVDLVRSSEVDQAASVDTPRIHRMYSGLTGDNPTKAVWWKDWLQSRQDRHDVAHRGKPMDQARAQKAVAVADSYLKHVTEQVEAARKKLLTDLAPKGSPAPSV